MNLELKNKNILVTGASKGIGKEIARTFYQEGANVAIVGRTYETLKQAKQEIGDIQFYRADVTKEETREQLFREFLQDFKTIDVLVNNAGGSSPGKALDTELQGFYDAFEYNYFSSVHLSQLAAQEMVAQKSGSIINVASIFGRESGGLVTYNNAKAALISFTKALAKEVIAKGINVNSIAPGSVYHKGGVWDKRMIENPEEIQQFIDHEIPGGRFGTPEEIAEMVVFMASNKASWLSGACINVDGGQSKMNM